MVEPQRLGLAGLWGIAGVLALLGQAIYRLTPMALDLVDYDLDLVELGALGAWAAFNGYAEGYRGFHKKFSPRVVARALHLSVHPRPGFVAIAPLYCIGLFHATRARLIVSWSVTVGIIGLVVLVRQLAQPWRGIIDAGVVIGLTWGVASILYHAGRAVTGHAMPVPADTPADR